MENHIKTSEGKLVKDHKCGIRGCEIQTKDYVWFGGSMLPVCEEHKKYAEKIKGKTENIKEIDFSKVLEFLDDN